MLLSLLQIYFGFAHTSLCTERHAMNPINEPCLLSFDFIVTRIHQERALIKSFDETKLNGMFKTH